MFEVKNVKIKKCEKLKISVKKGKYNVWHNFKKTLKTEIFCNTHWHNTQHTQQVLQIWEVGIECINLDILKHTH